MKAVFALGGLLLTAALMTGAGGSAAVTYVAGMGAFLIGSRQVNV